VDLRPIARDAVLDARDRTRADGLVIDDAPRRGAAPGIRAADGSAPTRAPAHGRDRRTAAPPPARGGARSAPPTPRRPLLAEREPIVLGDENRIRQVVANLLGNARRYTPAARPSSSPWASTNRWDGLDLGHRSRRGHRPQIRDKIFQRFWRADTSRTRRRAAPAWGCRSWRPSSTLHGSIVVSETPGGGATFRVAFPLAQRRDAAEHLFIETQPLPRLHRRAPRLDSARLLPGAPPRRCPPVLWAISGLPTAG
jgi:two-component system OmpR family sensor kinase